MTFELTEQHIREYWDQGLTVLREVVPAAMVVDLRREVDKGLQAAREERGQQTQRYSPSEKYGVDMKVFHDYWQLPELNDALAKILSPGHKMGTTFSVLVEPVERPYCTYWHRDGRPTDEVFDADPEFFRQWQEFCDNPLNCSQINCALYFDSCTWYVPGSSRRQWNLPGETAAMHAFPELFNHEKTQAMGPAAVERGNLKYCRNMPGAVQIHLGPGDFALYRACGWHLGNYVPYRKRATMHDVAISPDRRAAWDVLLKRSGEAMKKVSA